MIFFDTNLPGARWIEQLPHTDARGAFSRLYCAEEFAAAGVSFSVAQSNLSINERAGTLRGMHYQLPPHAEAKLVLCVCGAFFDVIVDLRKDSPTYLKWQGFTLRADKPYMLYIPEGFAHGFQTLEDHTSVLYYMGSAYCPDAARGFRYDDPAVGILWPEKIKSIAEKDLGYPALQETER